eukprot:TRINITY_DN17308_c0_g1_i1.p1 TRINITY_DN17308_c0_g1~~TRINITY_DN17308_c0_g1_i1.p1  ORF type:complete len:866 (+),score=233.60 TRINITY_DN17308_c0_g1_i1:338-2599(+)
MNSNPQKENILVTLKHVLSLLKNIGSGELHPCDDVKGFNIVNDFIQQASTLARESLARCIINEPNHRRFALLSFRNIHSNQLQLALLTLHKIMSEKTKLFITSLGDSRTELDLSCSVVEYLEALGSSQTLGSGASREEEESVDGGPSPTDAQHGHSHSPALTTKKSQAFPFPTIRSHSSRILGSTVSHDPPASGNQTQPQQGSPPVPVHQKQKQDQSDEQTEKREREKRERKEKELKRGSFIQKAGSRIQRAVNKSISVETIFASAPPSSPESEISAAATTPSFDDKDPLSPDGLVALDNDKKHKSKLFERSTTSPLLMAKNNTAGGSAVNPTNHHHPNSITPLSPQDRGGGGSSINLSGDGEGAARFTRKIRQFGSTIKINPWAASTANLQAETPGQGQGQVDEKELNKAKKAAFENLTSFYTNQTDREKSIRLRQEVISEFVGTETLYLRNIQEAVKLFIEPLQRMTIISKEELNDLFSNIDELITPSQKFLRYFQGIEDLPPEEQTVGYIFLKLVGDLDVYTTFCINQHKSLRARELLMKRPAFTKFINDVARSNPELFAMDESKLLDDLLIQPMQRICRYPLLLTELLKHTEETHPDYPDVKKSLTLVNAFVLDINNRKKKEESAFKLNEIANRFNEKDVASIVTETRVPVDEWKCEIKTKAGEKTKKGVLFLFNDLLLIGAYNRNKKLLSSAFSVPLSSCSITDYKNSKNKFGLYINDLLSRQSIVVKWSTFEEAENIKKRIHPTPPP